MAEKHTIFFALRHTQSNAEIIQSEFEIFKKQIRRVAKPLWDYGKRPLDSIEQIPFSNPEAEYGVAYSINKDNLVNVEINQSLILISHSSDIGMSHYPAELTKVLRRVFDVSLFVVCGFEIELYLDDIYNCVKSLIDDASCYPIYAKFSLELNFSKSDKCYKNFYLFSNNGVGAERIGYLESYIDMLSEGNSFT